MEDGRYRVDLEIVPRVPIETPSEAHKRANRMNIYLPAGGKVVADHYHPEFDSIDLIIEVEAPTAVEALAEVARSLEELSIKIREEHDRDPMGPMPVLRRCIITHAPRAGEA